jgi:hypothetical protein
MSVAVLEAPRTLPGDLRSLSHSSLTTYLKCPLKWKRRYLDGEFEPASGNLIVRSAVGRAESISDQRKIDDGDFLPLADVLDAYSDEWDLKVDQETDRMPIDWDDQKPGDIKDSGTKVLTLYHKVFVPALEPVAVERPFVLHLPGVDFTYRGYLDLETADGLVIDRKVKAKSLTQDEADADVQPTSYLLARRTEGNPAKGFRFDVLKRLKKEPKVDLVETGRTEEQLNHFAERILLIAAEIAWRAEYDKWQGAVPGSWWCSAKYCGFHATCPFGGLGR